MLHATLDENDDHPSNKKIKTNTFKGQEYFDNEFFNDFRKFFKSLNTLYTFLICRKQVITTFEKLKIPIEKQLKRKLSELDFSKVQVILPNDTLFKYIDENQIFTEAKEFDFKNGFQQKDNEDIFKLKNSNENSDNYRSTQLLIFEFIDGNMKKNWTTISENLNDPNNKYSHFNNYAKKVFHYSSEDLKKMINKRELHFNNRLIDFINKCTEKNLNPENELTYLATSMLPQMKNYEDPIVAMEKAKLLRNNKLANSNNDEDGAITIPEMIQSLKNTTFYNSQIKEEVTIESKHSQFENLNFNISEQVLNSLPHKKFYTHQADAINAINNGENVIITTSTSSGKSLIYQLSTIDFLLKKPNSTFLYIFPTKALAQDQKRAFENLLTTINENSNNSIPELRNIIIDTYDGDTDQQKRKFIRDNARIIFTNPDMIHTSILPNHPKWRPFLYNLTFIVVDELHIYKSLFGSHVVLVMRRLQRLCREYYENNFLQFISCSATLKNPIKHMQDIFSINDVTLINNDGSSTGAKHLVIWNPQILAQHERKRESFIRDSAKILVELMLKNVRTIAFCYVRRVCELLMKEVRLIFQEMNRMDMITDVMSYRGGYSASDRRKIEREMFHGNLKAVISTNALELGIDIGNLDAVLMCGFPLSVANFHQQSGRAGRRNKDSLTLVVASDSPVDQHYVAHPESLINSDDLDSYQDLVLNFDNMLILESHIQCAAFELPINIERDSKYFEEKHLLKICHERLQSDSEGYHTHPRFLPWPSSNVSLRGVEEDYYAVIDRTNGKDIVIEEIEASRTSFTLYDGAILIHQGYPYLVKEFNVEEKYASVIRVDVDWLTSQRDFTDVDPQEIELIRSLENSDVPVYFGKFLVTIVVFGYFKVDKYNRIMDSVETYNPPINIRSKGLWIDLPSRALDLCEAKNLNIAGAIHAAEHAIMGLLPKFIVAGVDEISTECKAPEKEFAERQTKRKRPARLVFYDSRGGVYGSGLSIKAFEHIDDILEASLTRVQECPCDTGCPDCVAASFCKEKSLVLSKQGCLILLHCILGHDTDAFIGSILDGPESNMPEIKVETVVPVQDHVNFSEDFKIIDVRINKNAKLDEMEVKVEEVGFKEEKKEF
ncbi:hypothetical protein TPHA_0E01420 [Tetrapisispora phaffii CBS 4417]|uniref:RNA helicase n=1 Tax=Tetrapisispora phaffii (strain ATCC 24235 / CBS 4417 / NBRC 1672 / NRRL Y-8282 / UCD 70-5) TaxID=1071381 RepID=G8BTK9_TETPH|nr:hypothetical protein TPHA_0E01420 [Tetrapisispora phaffii CBS 4417]CCE63237.1 hypothetical protein TPHA_0E01420 [Tetrapisispora phaffii CBS 4417]